MKINFKKTAEVGVKKDWRLTSQRLMILDFLRSTRTHPMAEIIYAAARRKMPNLSFGTVYRNLKFLQEHGFIKEFVVDKVSRYDERVDAHIHLICDGCRQIFDLADDKLTAQVKRLAQHHKFFSRSENMEIRGYCPNCQKKLSVKKKVPELFCIACGELLDDLKKEAPVCRACCFKTNCNYYEHVEI
jgi:Fur family peroxide stress response transcriptional regulator